MKKKYKILLILLLMPLAVFSQDNAYKKIDSLKFLLSISQHSNEVLIDIYAELGFLYASINPDSCLYYCDKGIELSKKVNDKIGEAECINNKASSRFFQDDLPKALEYYYQSLKINIENGNNKGILRNFNNIGIVYGLLKDYEKAIEVFSKADNIAQALKDSAGFAFVYGNLGYLYFKLNDNEKALNYVNKAILLSGKFGNPSQNAQNYSTLGSIFESKKEYFRALDYFKKAMDISQKYGSKYQEIQIYSSISNVYLSMASEKSDTTESESKKDLLIKSIEFSKKGLDLIEPTNKTYPLALYMNLANAYNLLNKPAEAFKYSKIYIQKFEEFNINKNFEEISKLKEKNDYEIYHLIKIQDENQQLRNNLLIAISIFIFLIATLLYAFYIKQKRYNKALSNQNFQIIETSKQLEIANEELRQNNIKSQKLALLQQLQPHFIFNALSALKSLIRFYPTEAENYNVKLSEFLRYSLQAYKNDLISLRDELKFTNDYLELQKVRFAESFVCNIEIPDEALNKSIPVYALQMLVENAMKHNSFTTKNQLIINISCQNDSIIVENNKNLKKRSAESGLGLKNLNNRYLMILGKSIIINDSEDKFSVQLYLESNENINHRG